MTDKVLALRIEESVYFLYYFYYSCIHAKTHYKMLLSYYPLTENKTVSPSPKLLSSQLSGAS